MRTVSAIDMRKHFGRLLDEAAAGERIVIERAGQPRAVLVPLEDLELVDPDRRLERRREALAELLRTAKRRPVPRTVDGARLVRRMRDERTAHLADVVEGSRGRAR
jgi:prevent-host-death family protein